MPVELARGMVAVYVGPSRCARSAPHAHDRQEGKQALDDVGAEVPFEEIEHAEREELVEEISLTRFVEGLHHLVHGRG